MVTYDWIAVTHMFGMVPVPYPPDVKQSPAGSTCPERVMFSKLLLAKIACSVMP